jgi:hypothetical protein
MTIDSVDVTTNVKMLTTFRLRQLTEARMLSRQLSCACHALRVYRVETIEFLSDCLPHFLRAHVR